MTERKPEYLKVTVTDAKGNMLEEFHVEVKPIRDLKHDTTERAPQRTADEIRNIMSRNFEIPEDD